MRHLVALAAAFALAAPLLADDPKPAAPVDVDAAFERLKALAGEWRDAESPDRPSVVYRVTGAGSALVETLMPGSEHEMVSVYHLVGEDLVMTHYCAVGNQPRLKLDRKASTADKLVFDFDGGTNVDPAVDMHIHGAVITFDEDPDHVKTEWTAWAEGKAVEGTTVVDVKRKK
jgi:hypothetical protein